MKRKLIRLASVPVLAALAASVVLATTATGASATSNGKAPTTTTPIKHVVIIILENHSFDNVFATYQPPGHQHIRNLLSEGIIKKNGDPGRNYAKASQLTATDTQKYTVTPKITGKYKTLPIPNTTYVSSACDGLPGNHADTRFPASLPDGPYQITKYVSYWDSHLEYAKFGQCEFFGAYVGDPLHRFYQMWQQSAAYHDRLAAWVPNTAGDDNGAIPPQPIYQGGVQMGFYNMAEGDAPIFRDLAKHYAISDNYHQAVQGGTGANHVMLGTGFAASYQNANGQAAKPPAGEIENPNPKPGTNNNYAQDGYGAFNSTGQPTDQGGSYSECANPSAPGVGAIDAFLARLPYKALANCQPGRYYLLNNYNPYYQPNGQPYPPGYNAPAQKTDYVTIGNSLAAHHISWKWFGEGYDASAPGGALSEYCNICDPMEYSASIMTNPVLRKDTEYNYDQFISEASRGTLPAVSFLKPGDDDGHPGYSTLAASENFVGRAVAAVQSDPKLWRSTAIFVTEDESGGYYDSGYIQQVSFFGDGPRVPLIAISPYAKPGFVDHTYTDHVSLLKFIEANWKLPPLTGYSEDNLPNATPYVYVPKDRPAIGNLMTLFNFGRPHAATVKLPFQLYAQPAPAHARLPDLNRIPR
jgi:phospholipase C